MANLQYIGARYVPKFYENPDTGDMSWKSGVGYEPLTVVTYNSDTYTSKKPVPSSVGNPASNPTYWAKTADFNAALVSLQNIVGDGNLDTTANNLTDAVNEINAIVTRPRFVYFVGDSYGDNPNVTIHYPTVCAADLVLGSRYVNACHSGNGFFDDSFLGQISGYTGDKTKVTDIVALGGLNDLGALNNGTISELDLKMKVRNFMQYAVANYPNAKIWVGILGWSSSIPADYGLITSWRSLTEAYTYATHYGAIFIDGFIKIVHDYSLLLADFTHPSDYGGQQIGHALASVLQGGAAESQKNSKAVTFTCPDSTAQLPTYNDVSIDNDNVYLTIGGILEYSAAKAVTKMVSVEVLNFSALNYIQAGNYAPFIPVTLEVTHSDNSVTGEVAWLVLSSNKIYLKFINLYDNVLSIKFNINRLVIPNLHV